MDSYQKINTEMYFSFYRGDDFAFRGEVKDKDTDEVIDITGWELKSTLKLSYMEDDTQSVVKVSTGILDNADAVNGIFYVYYPREQTEHLTPAKYYFDIQRELEDTVITVIQGRVGIKGDVTTRTQANPQGIQKTLEDYKAEIHAMTLSTETVTQLQLETHIESLKNLLKLMNSQLYASGTTDAQIEEGI